MGLFNKSAEDWYKKGIATTHRQKKQEWLLKAAEMGHVGAMFELGNTSAIWKAKKEDWPWLLKAARHGHEEARGCVWRACVKETVQAMRQDPMHTQEAINFCLEEATRDTTDSYNSRQAEAMWQMAHFCFQGFVPGGREAGLDWLTRAVDKWPIVGNAGNYYAHLLANMYLLGKNLPQSDEEYMKWLHVAAEQKDRRAIRELVQNYYHGQHTEANYEKAVEMWQTLDKDDDAWWTLKRLLDTRPPLDQQKCDEHALLIGMDNARLWSEKALRPKKLCKDALRNLTMAEQTANAAEKR